MPLPLPLSLQPPPAGSPSHRRRRRRGAAAVAVAAALGLAWSATPSAAPRATAQAVVPLPPVQRIATEPGVTLDAMVYAPAPTVRARGARPPLLVMPGTWIAGRLPYLLEARHYADAGYLVVAYSPRGWGSSTGTIDTAGPRDVRDLSAVIDWAVRSQAVDPERIGVLGYSYGAGIGLLGAAADPRIDAVAAIGGWADLEEALLGRTTEERAKIAVLAASARLLGRPSPELTAYAREALTGSATAAMRTWAKTRSPRHHLKALNAHRPAVFLVHNWGDMFVAPPAQMVRFFTALQGPKHLELRPGDHVEPLVYCGLNLRIAPCRRTQQWLDTYVRDRKATAREPRPLLVRPRLGHGDEGYTGWQAMTGRRPALRPLVPRTATVRTGVLTGAEAGLPGLSPTLDKHGLPQPVVMPLLPGAGAAVWDLLPGRPTPLAVRGTPSLTLSVTPSAARGTLFAYLYEVEPLGVGRLISHVPFTFRDRVPGVPFTVELEMGATAYDVPAGNRISLVVDTTDPLYRQHNPPGARMSLAPSHLTLPLRSGAPALGHR
ncbi:alpha/beta fold hydrolase [Streptomyces sp. NPDC045431]|uniref:alpha/beta fold hydrolase n=1 Tax=Streptomyces sp. NPDC045431 TaxID=3155613 RepID=UPI0033C6194E